MMKGVEDADTVPDPDLPAGTLIESLAWEPTSDRAAAVAAVTWTSPQLLTFPPESVLTM